MCSSFCTCVPAGVPGEAGRGHISIRDLFHCHSAVSVRIFQLTLLTQDLRVSPHSAAGFCFPFSPSLLLGMNFQAGWRLPQLRFATWKQEVCGIKSVWTLNCSDGATKEPPGLSSIPSPRFLGDDGLLLLGCSL